MAEHHTVTQRGRAGATVRHFARSAVETAWLLAGGRLRAPRAWLGRRLTFADGTTSLVFRETAMAGVPIADPAVLVVQFRLRLIGTNRLAHGLFWRECLLHTPLFAGFPGFRTKLWLSDVQTGVYRGVYEWDGADRAVAYAETLARLLRLVSQRGSVRYHVVPGLRRDDLLAGMAARFRGREWWRLVAMPSAVERSARWQTPTS